MTARKAIKIIEEGSYDKVLVEEALAYSVKLLHKDIIMPLYNNYCQQCNSKIDEHSKYCPYCGQRLKP